ncbi:MAG: MOSC domain-containing protein [Saprospiraceae bacterium]
MQLSQINIYTLKSTQAVALEEALVNQRGIATDRRWALIGADNATLTGRDFSQLLDLRVETNATGLNIYRASELVHTVTLPTTDHSRIPIHIFSNSTTGLLADEVTNQWFSDYLQTEARLVYMDDNSVRGLGEKYGGNETDSVSLADEGPILLLSEASIADLNSRLETPITVAHFRPNLVVKDATAFAEDSWKRIRIGEAEFKAGRQCKRCVFTTIDPVTKEKNPNGEPLRTLNSYRKGPEGGVIFGQLLIPTKMGKIKIGDTIEVIE